MSAQAALYGGQAGLQLASGYFASQNIKDTAALNRDIAAMNAEFAELDAYDSRIEGESAKARYQTVIDQTMAEQQLALTAANVDVGYGSVGEIAKETAFVAELNKMEIEKRAQEKSLGYERQARDIRFNADFEFGRERARAKSVLFQSVMSATGSAANSAQAAGLTGYKRGPKKPTTRQIEDATVGVDF